MIVNKNKQGLLHIVGDVVFFMRGNSVSEMAITGIDIQRIGIYYDFEKHGTSRNATIEQKFVFDTKQQLLDSL